MGDVTTYHVYIYRTHPRHAAAKTLSSPYHVRTYCVGTLPISSPLSLSYEVMCMPCTLSFSLSLSSHLLHQFSHWSHQGSIIAMITIAWHLPRQWYLVGHFQREPRLMIIVKENPWKCRKNVVVQFYNFCSVGQWHWVPSQFLFNHLRIIGDFTRLCLCKWKESRELRGSIALIQF